MPIGTITEMWLLLHSRAWQQMTKTHKHTLHLGMMGVYTYVTELHTVETPNNGTSILSIVQKLSLLNIQGNIYNGANSLSTVGRLSTLQSVHY